MEAVPCWTNWRRWRWRGGPPVAALPSFRALIWWDERTVFEQWSNDDFMLDSPEYLTARRDALSRISKVFCGPVAVLASPLHSPGDKITFTGASEMSRTQAKLGFMVVLGLGLVFLPLTMPTQLSAQEDCFGCELVDNEQTQQGWTCTQGQQFCHLHESFIATGDNYWLNEHPQNIYLDGTCHNLCGDFLGGAVDAASAFYASITSGQALTDAVAALHKGNLEVEIASPQFIRLSSAECGGELLIPILIASHTAGRPVADITGSR